MRSLPNRQKRPLARRTARTQDIPAPLGGINTRDSLAIMPPIDAIDLVNWLPQANGLVSRNGSAEASDGYPAYVETAITYVSGLIELLITASADELSTDNGAGTVTSLGTGFLNARWQSVQLGANMILVNGQDSPRNFDGSILTTPAFSGDLSTYGATNIDGAHKYRNRVYLFDSDYPDFFYGGTNSVSGAFTKFQLSRVSDTGGNIVEVKTISRDSGNGPDDYLAFILHTGEVVVYLGSDPGDADNFSLVGKFRMPPIIGKRCATEFSGDVVILTKQDVVKLSDIIKFTGEAGGFNLTPSKLSGGIAADYQSYSNNYGFSISTYPKGGWIIINIPETTNSVYHQYVINTVTGACTKFRGWNAACFATLNDSLYFGNNMTLDEGDVGTDDKGLDIELFCKQAFSNLSIAFKKKISNVRLFIASAGTLNIDLAIGYDFSFPNPQGVQSSGASGAQWNVSLWNVTFWSGVVGRLINFVVAGIGVYVGLQTRLLVNGQQVNWYATTYNFDIAETY